MALVSFDELQAANPAIKSLGFDPTQGRSVARTEEDMLAERARAAEVANRSVFGAAFQEDNMVASMLSQAANPNLNVDKGDDFDVVKFIDDNGMRGYEDEFMGALNKDFADAILSDVQRKQRNQETLAAAGWAGTFASIAAGTLDLPTLFGGLSS